MEAPRRVPMYTKKRKQKVFLYPSFDFNRIASLPIRSLKTGINSKKGEMMDKYSYACHILTIFLLGYLEEVLWQKSFSGHRAYVSATSDNTRIHETFIFCIALFNTSTERTRGTVCIVRRRALMTVTRRTC